MHIRSPSMLRRGLFLHHQLQCRWSSRSEFSALAPAMFAGKGGGFFERIKRCVRTVYFVVCMVASLFFLSAPLLVSFGDVLINSLLLSSFACVRCLSFREYLQRYDFTTALIDIPLVSIARSLVIICVYSFCNGPRLSHGPYLGITWLCSFLSILVLSVKACVFTSDSKTENGAPSSLVTEEFHLKKLWGMPFLFLVSIIFGLGHIAVAYRTSYRARRKLLFHRVDPEALLSCKHIFSGHQKIPRSPTPTAGKTPRCNSEIRRKLFCTVQDEQEFSVRPFADTDSLFIVCQGLTLHYKLGLPESSSLSSPYFVVSSLIKPNTSCRLPQRTHGMLKLDKPPLGILPKAQYHRHKSFNNQLSDTLCTPLLDFPVNLPAYFSEKTSVMSCTDFGGGNENILNNANLEGALGRNGKFGIILVHGFGGGVFSWRHVMVALARQVGCTVTAFDRPGWGLTSRPCRKDWEEKEQPNPYKLESQVDLLISFCLEMGFSSVVLVGHDDGGLLALKAAQRIQASSNSFHIEIRGLVLLSLSLSRDVVPPLARILLRTSLGKKHLVRPLLRTEITQVVNRRAWYDATKLTMEVLNLYKAPLCIEGWDEALNEIAKLSSETVLSSQNAALLLKVVEDLPVLIITGAEDAVVSLKSVQTMVSKLVNSRLVTVSGCGHLPHEECPEAVLAAISPFITRLLPAPDPQRSSQKP
ncbi:uncharacterized protein LOC131158158 isoform X2 [Malania oleifera]|uniref:uncharacterized protein LOC131158158 isoform X2 n=1 Tax=Malania oleifera TaxID=397392 RepID=UPI0025ADD27D|nr:uncharacterized protein LOC131158158 isoform X2 [Malania oleifera]